MMKKIFFAVFLVILLTMAGCNSPPEQNAVTDSTVDTQAGQNDNGQTVTTVPEEKIATTQVEAAQPVETKPAVGADLKAQLMGLFSGATKEYMVAYDTTISGGGQPDYTAKMTYYLKGADKLRVDTLANMPGAGDSRFYKVSGDFIMCNKQGADWSCIKIPQQDPSKDPNNQSAEIQKNFGTSEIAQLPDRVIAGVTAKCFKMIVSVNADEAKQIGMSTFVNTYCISSDGVLLFSDSQSNNMHIVQQATSYVTNVADSEFVPPAEPKDIASGIPGVPTGNPTGYTLPDGVTMPEIPATDEGG